MTGLLIAAALAFAWSMGAHYTGACMGMPRALGAVSSWHALLIMAPLTVLGAALASHAVEHTVADRLSVQHLAVAGEVVVIAVAFGLTSLYNRLKVPTSTIQILVFSLAGTALAAGAGVHWATIGLLAVVWLLAPMVAAGLGYLLTRLFDRVPDMLAAGGEAGDGGSFALAPRGLGIALVVVGAGASFAMGANDVANATGSLVGTHTLSPLAAGALGGAGLALGVLTWGKPLLRRIAFEIVQLDRPMATAAQAVQAVVVLVAVSFGLFTSMNQALVGAMAGAGAARGRSVVNTKTLRGIVRGWLLGPAAGIALGYLAGRLVLEAGVRLR